MKSTLRHLFRYKATENYFFRETGYNGEDRRHATVCILCWMDKAIRHFENEPPTVWRTEISKFFRQRRITCPHIRGEKKLIIPWGRNRKNPPQGCIRVLEHAVVCGKDPAQ